MDYLGYIRKKTISEPSLEATSRLPCLDPSEESHPNLLRTSPMDTLPVFFVGQARYPFTRYLEKAGMMGDSEWIYDIYINICIHVTIYM